MPTSPQSPGGATTRCVLWRSPDRPTPAELVESLRRRGVELVECRSAFEAMARLCVLEHGDGAGSRPRYGPREPVILVLVEPGRLPRAAEVVASAAVYAPHAACWVYEAAHEPKLRLYDPPEAREGNAREDGPRSSGRAPGSVGLPPGGRRHGAQAPTKPALRLTETEPAPEPGPEPAVESTGTTTRSVVLSEEELAMLLGDGPFAADGGRA
ncbi:MAG TPA: hypothetical protein VD963_04240 [Phycisphaerales bacterium]|nr:hypothetical protein [Phycisphaerales bacterium]